MTSQVDPIDGGSANDYDYASQDALNAFDLAGMMETGSGDKPRRHAKPRYLPPAIKPRPKSKSPAKRGIQSRFKRMNQR
jgi:hypothetical protein